MSEYSLEEAVSVNRDDLNSEFVRLSADLAYWGEQLAEAEHEYSMAKLASEKLTAEAFVRYKEHLQSTQGRTTDSSVNAMVTKDHRIVASKTNLLTKTHERNRLKSVVESIRAKKEMIISLGAQMRAEMQSENTTTMRKW